MQSCLTNLNSSNIEKLCAFPRFRSSKLCDGWSRACFCFAYLDLDRPNSVVGVLAGEVLAVSLGSILPGEEKV